MQNSSNQTQLVETLNDLVKINHDRIEGYRKAEEQAKENVDLKAIFVAKQKQSEAFAQDLKKNISSLGGEYSTDTTKSGKIFRAWMDVKNTFKPSDRSSILESCEFGEKAALDAYSASLESDAEIPSEVRQLILAQKEDIVQSHETIKKYIKLDDAL